MPTQTISLATENSMVIIKDGIKPMIDTELIGRDIPPSYNYFQDLKDISKASSRRVLFIKLYQ